MINSHLIKIGNSKGIIIPKEVRRQCHLTEDIVMTVEDGRIIISNPEKELPRKGWAKAFKRAGVDTEPVFMDGVSNDFDDKEWTW